MIERLSFMMPEIALFVTTCVVMVVGLSRVQQTRNATAVMAGLGIIVAGVLAYFTTPDGADAGNKSAGQVLLPHMAAYMKLVIAGVGLLLLMVQAGTVDRVDEAAISAGRRPYDALRANRAEYYAFFLFSLTGLMLCASADSLIWLFLALELTSLPTYIMVTISTARNRSREAGVKYFFLGALGAAVFLYGFALIYGGTGCTNLNDIALSFMTGGINSIAMAGLLLSVLGLGFKIAAVPMHFYTADVYEGAAPQVSGFLAFVPKAAGFIALLLLLSTAGWHFERGSSEPSLSQVLTGGITRASEFGRSLPESVRLLLWVMAALTMTIGNVLALLQTSVKRTLAYSSVAHSGYMLVGVVAGPGDTFARSGISAVLFYLLSYGVMSTGTFAVLAAMERKAGPDGEAREVDQFDDLRGLTATHPLLGWVMTICSLSLLGLPPLLGFFGKLPLFTSAIHAREYVLVIVLGLNSAIAAFYYLRLAFFPFLEKKDEFVEPILMSPFGSRTLGAIVSAAGVIVLAVIGSRVMAGAELAGSTHVQAVESVPMPAHPPETTQPGETPG
ncbi:MAG: NADH-quinone oxidoreductase subunit N [Phycisphaerales bacterium]